MASLLRKMFNRHGRLYHCVVSSMPMHNVPFTSSVYSVNRGDYGKVTTKDREFFADIVGSSHVITDTDDIEGYNIDWMRTVRGQSKLLLKPKTSQEVSSILKHCNERKLAVCPQGGNTGLVGGSVPVFDEIILSTERMNEIISVDPISGVLVCQAGSVLEKTNEHLDQYKMMVPLDLGAKGSCHLGGNLSTNAGGLRLLRYGSLRGTVLGIEAVLADGTILDCLSTLRKDNTGYDVKQLLIGSEGTLGIVTALSILCPQKPSSLNLAFLGTETFEDLLKLLREAKSTLGEILSAVEFMDAECMRLATTHLNLTNPIEDYQFYMLVETAGSNSEHDEEKLNVFLEKIMEKGWAKDGTVATDRTKMKVIWALRERLAEALLRDGYNFKYDMSLPTHLMYDLVTATREHLRGKIKTALGYGHLGRTYGVENVEKYKDLSLIREGHDDYILMSEVNEGRLDKIFNQISLHYRVGDGNLHLNITCEQYTEEIHSAIEPFVYEWTKKHKGSISAEHGLGFKKRQYINYSKSPEVVGVMHQLKNLFDPNAILNPYKTLPDPEMR